MNIVTATILAIIEGITEFLPISSTGHLILASHLLQLNQTEFVKSFEIIIQLGAILAVVFLYFKKLISDFKLWINVLIAFIPSTVFGFLLYGYIKNYLIGNTLVVVWSLLIGGAAMIMFEKFFNKSERKELQTKDYLLVGLFQVFSMIPGVSRAFATILGAMTVGMDRKRATEFSFFLAIPTMFGASALDLVKTDLSVWTSSNTLMLAVGFIGSFITALITIKWLISFVQRNNFVYFGIYRIILALICFILLK